MGSLRERWQGEDQNAASSTANCTDDQERTVSAGLIIDHFRQERAKTRCERHQRGHKTVQGSSSLGATLTELNAGNPRLTLQGLLGANIGRLRAQATWNHTSGFDVVCTTQLIQDRIGAFDTINMFFMYDVPGESALLKDLSFTLNVNNVLDTDPPAYKQTGLNGFATAPNEFTLGRLFLMGVSKKF